MKTQSPACVPLPTRKRFIDISDQTFGSIKVLGFAGEDRTTKQVRNLWWCRCGCGNVFKTRGDHLKSGNTTNCGCVRRISVGNACRTHGHCINRLNTAEYRIWSAIIQRCECVTHRAYEYYGGRGIVMCARWRESFEAFFSDMGSRPSKDHSIDRKDNSGNYEPGNCHWATRLQQMQNTRHNHFITFQGTTLCVTEWARRIGMRPETLFSRLSKSKWSVERSLTTPLNKR